MSKEPAYRKHPAFAITSFSRITGAGCKFFGSAVSPNTYIRLKVMRAQVKTELGQDWIGRNYDSKDLIQVDFTPAQFAELLTTMNIGEGVPSTLKAFNGEMVEPIPQENPSETGNIIKEFREGQDRNAQQFEERGRELKEILAKKTISMSDRQKIANLIDRVVMEVRSNIPFQLEQFNSAAEKVVVQKKAEIDAFMTHNVINRGLESLLGNGKKKLTDDKEK